MRVPILKAQPTSEDLIDGVLTNVSVAYMQSQDKFVAMKAAPIVPVDDQGGKYYIWTKEDWFRDEAKIRPDGGPTAGGGFRLSNDSYWCNVWGFHKDIGPQLTARYRKNPFRLEQTSTEFVTRILMLRQERQFVTDFMASGKWSKDYAGVAADEVAGTSFRQWSDLENSDPIADIEEGRDYIETNTGFSPNTLVISSQVWKYWKQHPAFLDRIRYSQKGIVTADLVAEVLELERILVAGGTYVTTEEGDTAAFSRIHPKAALLCYVAPAPGIDVPSAIYTFAWTGYAGSNAQGVAISKLWIPETKVTRVEGEMAYGQKMVAQDLGVYYKDAVA